jgi:hypothetical protein
MSHNLKPKRAVIMMDVSTNLLLQQLAMGKTQTKI